MFRFQNRFLQDEHVEGDDLPGSDSPEDTTGSDSQPEKDWKAEAQEYKRLLESKSSALKRTGTKKAELETQLKELQSQLESLQGDPETTDEKTAVKREIERLQSKHSKEVGDLQAQLSAAIEQLNSGKKQATLEKLVSQYVDADMVDVFMSAYGSKFEIVDGELEVDGLPPTSFIESVIEQKPKFKPAPRKGIGVAGGSTGNATKNTMKRSEWDKLDPYKQGEAFRQGIRPID